MNPTYTSADFTPAGEWGTVTTNPDDNDDGHEFTHEPTLNGSVGPGAEPEYAGFDSTHRAYADTGIVGTATPYDDLRGARKLYSQVYAEAHAIPDSTRRTHANAGIVGGGAPYNDLLGARRVYSRDTSSVAEPFDSYEENSYEEPAVGNGYEEIATGSGYEEVNDGLDGVYAEISAAHGGSL